MIGSRLQPWEHLLAFSDFLSKHKTASKNPHQTTDADSAFSNMLMLQHHPRSAMAQLAQLAQNHDNCSLLTPGQFSPICKNLAKICKINSWVISAEFYSRCFQFNHPSESFQGKEKRWAEKMPPRLCVHFIHFFFSF